MNGTEIYVYRFYLVFFTMILKFSTLFRNKFFILNVQMKLHYKHVAFL